MIYHPKTGWREGTFIIIALFIQVLITALNDHSKDTQFVRLQLSALDEELPVVRGKAGAMQTLNIWDLVVGDVVMLNRGDKAPADCVIIEAINCVVDERNVVESDVSGSVEKKAEDRLFAGSYLTSGEAKVVVCAVGAHSSRGDVDELHDTRDQDTTLTRKLDKIGGSLKFIGLIAAISILVLSMVVLLITVGSVDGKEFLKKFVDNLTLALIILIVAIPEGIPMTVGVSLAYSVLYMYDNDHLLVRDLTAVETLGLVDELVMGKTGTMTTEEMQVVSFYI
jgi:Ca2+-transporting ATPase